MESIRIKRYKFLTETKKEFALSKQLLRSGTSIGSNLAEAECSISRENFLAKVYIALKESAESLYWLELLHETEYMSDTEFHTPHSTLPTPHSTLHKNVAFSPIPK
ncbi:MAG: four helix bundle protein [Bacillota bacterium]